MEEYEIERKAFRRVYNYILREPKKILKIMNFDTKLSSSSNMPVVRTRYYPAKGVIGWEVKYYFKDGKKEKIIKARLTETEAYLLSFILNEHGTSYKEACLVLQKL